MRIIIALVLLFSFGCGDIGDPGVPGSCYLYLEGYRSCYYRCFDLDDISITIPEDATCPETIFVEGGDGQRWYY